jgi:hypothetical protein
MCSALSQHNRFNLICFTEKLRGSVYGSPENVAQIAERFDETTKRTFKSVEDPCIVQFGSTRDNDATCNIRSGKLKLTGWVKPSVCLEAMNG